MLSYAINARNNLKYDFKSKGGNTTQNHYRGMYIKNSEGKNFISTARDIGNYSAGYVAVRRGLSWKQARFGFDLYQKNGKESETTQAAQRIGFFDGMKQRNKD